MAHFSATALAPEKGGGSQKMRTAIVSFLLVVFLASAAIADRPAMQAALGGLVGNSSTDPQACGDPATNRINVPLPIVLGKFFCTAKIFPVVNVINGDQKDIATAEAALRAELQKVAFVCNFEVVKGTKPPAGTMLFLLTVVKDSGESRSTSYSSDFDSWGRQSNRSGSSNRTESGSFFISGESTFVGTAVSGGLDLVGECESTTGLAFIADVFSGNAERTGSSFQDTTARSWNSASRRWGNDWSSHTATNGSTFESDQDYSKRQSSRVTINEAVQKAVHCVLSQGIDYYNLTRGLKLATQSVAGQQYDGDLKYIAVDE